MTFWEHLDELRGVIIRSVLAVCLLSVVGFLFKDFVFDVLVLGPTRPDFCVYRLLGWDVDMNLINVEICAQFYVHLKVSAALGLVFSFPYIIYALWNFIRPALYETEKSAVGTAFAMSSGLFYLGVAVGYFIVLPVCLQFFMNYSVSDSVENTITLQSYISMFFSMVLTIGLVFEFPTAVLLLNRLGILGKETLRKGRRYAFVTVLVISALVTPTDAFSMLVLAIPLYFLYELSILLCSSSRKETPSEQK